LAFGALNGARRAQKSLYTIAQNANLPPLSTFFTTPSNTHGKSQKETPLEDEQAQTPETLESIPP
jgi:hypothetical protein